MKRRAALVLAAGVALLPPARATPEAMAAAIRSFTGGAPLREGKVPHRRGARWWTTATPCR